MMDQVMVRHYTRCAPMQPPFTTRPDIRGTFGAVATTHWLATQTGMAVLERGGNAFDAAVAAGFVLQIVEPHLNGPGGELRAIVMRAGADAPEVICGQGPFPAAASAERLRAMGLAQMPGTGLLPAVVPGAFDGWMLLLRDYGTLKLRDVLSYAIFYAEHGFPLVPRIVGTIIPAVDYFQTEWPSSGEVWLANGKAPHPDKPFRTPAIAETYRRILTEAEVADVPLDTLLSKEYADTRRKLIGERASMELRPGDIGDARERMRRVLAMAGKEKPVGPGAGEPTFAPLPPEWGDTVHLDIVDAAGNMISATPSGGWLQGSPVVPGLGFPISTRGQICWLEEGHPSTLRPGTRPRITLSPTLVTRDGAPYLAIGTPGGDQQEQWILAVFLRLRHHRMSLQQAIDAPMFQTRHMVQSFHPRTFEPGRVVLEDRFPLAARKELEARGHLLTVEGPWALGRICAVGRWDGFLRAAATPRLMQAYAAGR